MKAFSNPVVLPAYNEHFSCRTLVLSSSRASRLSSLWITVVPSILVLPSAFLLFPPPLQPHCSQILFQPLSPFPRLPRTPPSPPLLCLLFLDHGILPARVSLGETLPTLCWPVPCLTRLLGQPCAAKPLYCHLAGKGARVIQKCFAKFKHPQQG